MYVIHVPVKYVYNFSYFFMVLISYCNHEYECIFIINMHIIYTYIHFSLVRSYLEF